MTPNSPLHLFEGFGVELEYMIVREDSLNTFPACDEVIKAVAGSYVNEVDRGLLNWSNELTLHVIEFKTNGPAASLAGLSTHFDQHVRDVNRILNPMRGRLMPTAMHPWMDPHAEMRLWPHENSPIYDAFNRIFDCKGHGWANLQSAHINLPFCGDEEFGRLHAAIRLVLPLLPAIAASSPFADAKLAGPMDYRLEVYRTNCAKVPMVTGDVIPEPVFTPDEYERNILQPLYREIAPLDPDAVLQDEWLNARGAIARFERDTIEVRLLDVQECPAADIAIVMLVTKTIRALVEEDWCGWDEQKKWAVPPLAEILRDTVRTAEDAPIDNREYLNAFGFNGQSATAGELWSHIYKNLVPKCSDDEVRLLGPVNHILRHGTLSRRIVRAVGGNVNVANLKNVYRSLCECLQRGEQFDGALHGTPVHV
ncbi:MAG: hypothetical protein AMXMBFR84_36730 [Candidatus Hydrogenedentota bacterium]